MKTIAKEFTVYSYDELDETAKEKVRQWYLDGQDAEIFTMMCKYDTDQLRSL